MIADPRSIHNLRDWDHSANRYTVEVPFGRHTAQLVILKMEDGWVLIFKPPGPMSYHEFVDSRGEVALSPDSATRYKTPEQAAMSALKLVNRHPVIQRGYDRLQGKEEVREPLPQFAWLRSLTATERQQVVRVAARYQVRRRLG